METIPSASNEAPVDIEQVLNQIEEVCKPTSIFLYGSQARGDTTPRSDYEIGVLLPADKYVGRAVLRDAIKEPNASVYPFRLEQFLAGNPDTPFNKKIYMREVIASGKTLRGEKLIEGMQLPSIETIDILSDAQFNLGYALAATIAHRDNSPTTANLLFYKSCLFGARALIMKKTGKLPATYDEIVAAAKQLNLEEYAGLVDAAYEARQTGIYDPAMLFKNISFLNQLIIPAIRDQLEGGNKNVVE